MAKIPKGKIRSARRREGLRLHFWPEGAHEMWHGPSAETGWAAVPRTLSVILCALQEPAVRGPVDLSRVYVDLWTRAFDEGMVEVQDEAEAAWASGFAKGRVRSWRDRVRRLEHIGFVKIFSDAVHDIAAIGLVHPHIAMSRLRRAGKISDPVWSLYVRKIDVAGASAPALPEEFPQLFAPPAPIPVDPAAAATPSEPAAAAEATAVKFFA